MKISLGRLFFMGIAVGAGLEVGKILPLMAERALSRKVSNESKAKLHQHLADSYRKTPSDNPA